MMQNANHRHATVGRTGVGGAARSAGRLAARRAAVALAVALGVVQLQGCFVLGAAAVGGTAMVATDRRSSGTQLNDKKVQLTASGRISDLLAGRGSVNVDVFNGQVLLTGQVPTEADKQQAQSIVTQIDLVRAVSNQLTVGPSESLDQQTRDTYITAKVRASFIDDSKLYSQALQITTTDGVVYLQGIVTQAEADEASSVAAGVSGVKKVVTLFDMISPAELQTKYTNTSQTPVTPPGSAPAVKSTP